MKATKKNKNGDLSWSRNLTPRNSKNRGRDRYPDLGFTSGRYGFDSHRLHHIFY